MVLPASGLIRKVGGVIAYQEVRDIVEFMRTGINRQRKRTATTFDFWKCSKIDMIEYTRRQIINNTKYNF